MRKTAREQVSGSENGASLRNLTEKQRKPGNVALSMLFAESEEAQWFFAKFKFFLVRIVHRT